MMTIFPQSPDDFPDLVIVLDRDARERPFWLRVKLPNGCDVVDLGKQSSLPGAVQAAEKLGFSPTHWTEGGSISPIPASVKRKGA